LRGVSKDEATEPENAMAARQGFSVTGKRFFPRAPVGGLLRRAAEKSITNCINSGICYFVNAARQPDRGGSSLFTAL
jgi:hypothetical protein